MATLRPCPSVHRSPPHQAPPARRGRARTSQATVSSPPGTLIRRSGWDSVAVGLLEGGRGLADTCTQVNGPDRCMSAEEPVETRTFDGREATNRAGAAERLGMSPATIEVYSSPGQRRLRSFPDPLPERVGGQDWWLLEDLDRYAETRTAPVPPVDNPAQLIDLVSLAELRNIKRGTAERYWKDSRVAWSQGRDGYLPQPDKFEIGPRGGKWPLWRRDRAAEWAFPGTRRTRGRQPGRRPVPEDLRRLRANNPGCEFKLHEEATLLSEDLGVPVSIQVIRRLRKRLAAELAGPQERAAGQPDVET